MTRSQPRSKFSPPRDYLALVERFPVRPLANDRELEAATIVIESLVGRSDLTPGQSAYLDGMSYFIEKFEDEHHPIDLANLEPIEMLRELMELREMSVSDLGRIVGSQPLASMILRERRGISKANIGKLAAHFNVDASLFIERSGRRSRRGQRPAIKPAGTR